LLGARYGNDLDEGIAVTAKIILVGNEKGGSGKTTLATNLATMAVAKGYGTLLIDSDPGQRSTTLWAARRQENHPDAPQLFNIELAEPQTMTRTIRDLARHYDVVVIDTGATDSPPVRACATLADVLAIPLQSDNLDLWALPSIAATFRRAQELGNHKLRAQVVLNRLLHHTADRAPTEIASFIQANVPELPAAGLPVLVARAAYGRASSDGLGVGELKGREFDAKAAKEMEAAYAAVMGEESAA
jgi:chromosome partitioning protein